MDFELTDTQRRYRDSAREIAEKQLLPGYRERERLGRIVVAYDVEDAPVTAEDLRAAGPSQWARTMSRFNKRYENAVVAIVEDGVAEGTFVTDTQPWVVAFGIIGMVAWSNRWFDPNESGVPAEEIGTAYADALLSGLEVGTAR